MENKSHIQFDLLKKEIAARYRLSYPSCTIPIEEWKGQDITNFQEELIEKVKGRISEKWFYTHIKSGSDKLPRIDMLNMLSQYAGYRDWMDFTSKKEDFTKEESGFTKPEDSVLKTAETKVYEDNIAENKSVDSKKPRTGNNTRFPRWLITAAIFIVAIFLFLIIKEDKITYRACFIDMNGHPLISNSKVEILLLTENESPVAIGCDSNACFEYASSGGHIRFIVKSPYYKTDTIIRRLGKSQQEQVKLETNDYALMIHYFSTSNVKDWRQRRLQLDDMISREAKIFQVYVDGRGMELLNKEEFINKLTMPLKSLKNIEVIETRYSGARISLLRFMQSEKQ